MEKSKLHSIKRGFTLVEILLAVFVLEIGLLGIAGFYAYSFKIAKTARNETIASNLAAGILDEQLANAFDNLTVGEGSRAPYSTEPDSAFQNFEKKVDIAYIDKELIASYTESESNKNMKKITVTTYWFNYEAEKSFQIASIKAKH